MPTRILCISNGHGEDSHTSHIIRALRQLDPAVEVAALPLVGDGGAYRAAEVPIVGPTLTLPSGGFAWMHRWMWLQDVRAGLIGLTWRQLRAVPRVAPSCAAVRATGDHVGQTFAWPSGRPFVSFISPLSALYDGHLHLNRSHLDPGPGTAVHVQVRPGTELAARPLSAACRQRRPGHVRPRVPAVAR